MNAALSKPDSSSSAVVFEPRPASPRVLCIGEKVPSVVRLQLQLDADFDLTLVSCTENCDEIFETEAPFDLVICDASVPEMWGASILEKLYAHSPEAERIVLSWRVTPAAKKTMIRDAHVMRVLLAPCPTMVLRAAVADALLRHRARALRATTPPSGNFLIPRRPVADNG